MNVAGGHAARLLAAAALTTAILASCSHPSRSAGPHAASGTAASGTATSGTAAGQKGAATTAPPVHEAAAEAVPGVQVPQGSTLVATTDGSIARFGFPGGPQIGTVPATWHGATSILPVIGSRPGWLEVRLAQRPNQSTAWVLQSDVKLAWSPYRIVVDLATTHLLLYKSGRLVLSVPAGIGTPAYPTPTGSYFLAFLAQPPNPGYGAFVMVTSAHSNVITDWESSGDALVAIHGPLGSDAQIGATGAAVSHGCVRLHESDLLKLRPVPAGTPIDIVAS